MAHHFAIFVFVFAMASSATSGNLSESLSSTRTAVAKFFEWFGNLSIFVGRVVRATFVPPYEVQEFVHQFDELGSKSLLLVALAGFFEKRGYNDNSELTEHAISRLPAGKPAKEFAYDPKEIFDKPDNAKLKNKKPLDAAGKYLEENPFGLVIVASAEAKGDTDKVRLLTEARAKVVRDYLIQNFRLDDKRVKTISFGKTKEAAESSKVVILVYPPKAPAGLRGE